MEHVLDTLTIDYSLECSKDNRKLHIVHLMWFK